MKVKVFKIALLFIIAVQFCIITAHAQINTVGREFWLGFMENQPGIQQPDMGVIVLTANESAKGFIDLGRREPGRVEHFDLLPGETFTLKLPSGTKDYLHRSSGLKETKSVYIKSDGDLSVYAFNERMQSADGTVVLPLQALGNEYIVTSHFETLPSEIFTRPIYSTLSTNNESLILIVGVEDNTHLQITPTFRTLCGKSANEPFILNLNAGESYQLKARGDLTGTHIKVIRENPMDCKNLAVFGGNKWTGVGQCGLANDHLFQQMYPTQTWGKEYIHVPFALRTSGELVKVVAKEDNTSIYIDGIYSDKLNSGQFKTYDFNSEDVKIIKASSPISVTVFAKSQECNVRSLANYNQGDPLMIQYSSNHQMLKAVNFEAMDVVTIKHHYVNVIVKSVDIFKSYLDRQNVGAFFSEIPANPEYAYARIPIKSGSHSLSNIGGFIAYVYGSDYLESYGYAVGASLEVVNFASEVKYDFEVIGEKVACLNQNGKWSIISTNHQYNKFSWDFGDGQERKEGGEVIQNYQTQGKFKVEILASSSEDACLPDEVITFEVEVLETKGSIVGETMICKSLNNHWYEAIDLLNVQNLKWTVEGGEILEEKENKILVKWINNKVGKIYAHPFSMNGCPGQPLLLEITLHEIISPSAPKGITQLGYNKEILHKYSVDQELEGRDFVWYIEGGKITSVNHGSEVYVQWDTPDIIGKIWYHELSQKNELCEGISPQLSVKVNPKLNVSLKNIKFVHCSGDDSGEITLDLEGGISPYTVKWSHDTEVIRAQASNLSIGKYDVKVTDAFGMEVEMLNLTIDKTPELQASVVAVQAPSCYEREDGEVIIKISGGIGPYIYDGDNAVLINDELTIKNLDAGERTVKIKDYYGCDTHVSFRLDSPMPLLTKIDVLKPSCPGETNGELLVTSSGGTGPYEYTWDFDYSNGRILNGAPMGTYSVTVVDAARCMAFGSGTLIEEAPIVRMPNGFRPAQGGINRLFKEVSNCQINFLLTIYNRWGELIHHTNEGWDGTLNGIEAPEGMYSYVYKYFYTLEGVENVNESRGTFRLIR